MTGARVLVTILNRTWRRTTYSARPARSGPWSGKNSPGPGRSRNGRRYIECPPRGNCGRHGKRYAKATGRLPAVLIHTTVDTLILIIRWRFVGKPVRRYDRTCKEASSLCVLMSP